MKYVILKAEHLVVRRVVYILSCFRLAGRQLPTKVVPSPPLLSWMVGRKYDKRLMV